MLCYKDEGKFDPRSIPLKSWNDYVSRSFMSTPLFLK
jgi:hypothetical protein